MDVGIMEALVDRGWAADTTHYFYGEHWKEYVWTSQEATFSCSSHVPG